MAAEGTTRYVAPTGSDSGDCGGSATPCQTIGYALGQAQDGDTISIGAGTYAEHLDIDKNLTLVAAGASTTAIDASTSGTVVTIGISNTATAVTLSGVTVQHGNTASNGGGINNAGSLTLVSSTVISNTSIGFGGIYNTGALTLTNSTVSDNTTNNGGGGIYNTGTLTLTNSTVSGNSTPDGSGGGIDSTGTLTLTNSTVSGNTAAGGFGGGIRTTGTTTLTNSMVVSNTTPLGFNSGGGGGIYNTGTLTLAKSTVSGNTPTVWGGGIYNDNSGTATLVNSTVSGNTASCCGGGIFNLGTLTATNSMVSGNTALAFSGGDGGGGIDNAGTLTLTTSTVSGNNAPSGGGISNAGTLMLTTSTVVSNTGTGATIRGGGILNSGTVALTNSTVSGNSASYGGGIYNYATHTDGATVTLTNSTVSDNSVSKGGGGGIYSYGYVSGTYTYPTRVTLTNSILAGNTAPTGPDCYNDGITGQTSMTSGGYNLLGIIDGCAGLTNGVNGDQVGTLSSPLVPWLDPLGDYGGPTLTMAPQPGSPALDAVPASHCTLTTDQRGQPRPDEAADGGACDVGAVEGTGPAPTISLSASSLDFGTESVDFFGVTQTVTLTNSSVVPLYLSSTAITITGTNPEDFLESDTCVGTTIAPGTTCTIDLNFGPGDAGPRSAVLSITDSAADSPQSVALSGSGQFAVAGVSPLALDFGDQAMGTTSAVESVTVQNTSQADLAIFGADLDNTGAFTATTSNCFGDSIAPGESCTFDVRFTPQWTMPGWPTSATGTLYIYDNAADSPQMVALSGTGTLPATDTPVPPGATATNTPVRPTSPPSTQPTVTPTQTPTPSAARIQPTATGVVCASHPAPPPLSVDLAPHHALVAGSSRALALSKTLRYVTGGGTLPLTIRTAPHATVTASLDVVATQVVIHGKGAHRTRTTRRVVLSHTALHGSADTHGRFSPLLHVAYQPTRPVMATLTVRARTTCGTAMQRTSLAILPLRITVTPHRVIGGSPLTITLHTGAHGQVSITLEVDTTRDTVMGQGTQRRRVRQVVALYRLRVTGTADAHGRFSRRVAIAYQPRTPLLASIAVTVRLPQGTATGRATATLLPRRHHL